MNLRWGEVVEIPCLGTDWPSPVLFSFPRRRVSPTIKFKGDTHLSVYVEGCSVIRRLRIAKARNS
jgi:hypothetical protein